MSLDTLDPARFKALTRSDELPRVREGLGARRARLPRLQDRHRRHARRQRGRDRGAGGRGRSLGAEIRFIEYMDVGGATRWTPDQVSHGPICWRRSRAASARPCRFVNEQWAPAARFRLPARPGDRDHLVDDRAVLRDLRPQPSDGRRHVVPLSLRDQRHGPASASCAVAPPTISCGSLIVETWHGASRPRRGGSLAGHRPTRVCADHVVEARPAPGDAHEGRIGGSQSRRRPKAAIGAKTRSLGPSPCMPGSARPTSRGSLRRHSHVARPASRRTPRTSCPRDRPTRPGRLPA